MAAACVGFFLGMLAGGQLGFDNACRQAEAIVVDLGDESRCMPHDKAHKAKQLREELKRMGRHTGGEK